MTELVVVAVVVAAVSGHPVSRIDPEVARLRAHFTQVDHVLRARDVSHLTAAQRRARATHIARLRAYAAAGVFPRNTRHPGVYVPYFVDDSGTPCAMAHLITESGVGDYVRRVVARINNAYVADIARDPELGGPLLDWLAANGLSLDEAARIQPAYGGEPHPAVPTGYKVGSWAAVVTGLTTVALNASLFRLGWSRRAGGWIGLAVGAAALALSVSALDEGDEYGTLRLVNGGVGVLAVGFGLSAVDQPRAPSRTTAGRAVTRLTGTPWVARDGRSGITLTLTF